MPQEINMRQSRAGDLLKLSDSLLFIVLYHDVAAQCIKWAFIGRLQKINVYEYAASTGSSRTYTLVARGVDDAPQD